MPSSVWLGLSTLVTLTGSTLHICTPAWICHCTSYPSLNVLHIPITADHTKILHFINLFYFHNHLFSLCNILIISHFQVYKRHVRLLVHFSKVFSTTCLTAKTWKTSTCTGSWQTSASPMILPCQCTCLKERTAMVLRQLRRKEGRDNGERAPCSFITLSTVCTSPSHSRPSQTPSPHYSSHLVLCNLCIPFCCLFI